MNSDIYKLMQLASGTFPSGSFSQSWGLETYVAMGKVHDASSFKDFLKMYLISNIGKQEGPLMLEAYRLAEHEDVEGLSTLNQLSNALKTTKESRQASIRTGRAMLRIMGDILNSSTINMLKEKEGELMNFAVIYGVCSYIMGIEAKLSLEAFIFNSVNSLVQSAIKLVPLGNTQAQRIIYDSFNLMEETMKVSMKTPIDKITNFCPSLDIASIKHENARVRLYMS